MVGAWLALLTAMPAAAQEDGTVDEIWVYGDYVVEMAKEEVIDQLQSEGYTGVIKKDDHVVYRHPAPWKGDVKIYDDGWLIIDRQPVQFRPAGATTAGDAKPLGWLGCVWLPSCIHPGGLVVSKRKFDAQRGRTYESAWPEISDWSDKIADRETDKRVEALPLRLEALWFEGVPLEGQGGTTFSTAAERKTALLDFWDSRTDTVWGDRVRIGVEAFMRGVVQHDDNRFTQAEVASFNARRHCERELDLWSPWDEVVADVQVEPY